MLSSRAGLRVVLFGRDGNMSGRMRDVSSTSPKPDHGAKDCRLKPNLSRTPVSISGPWKWTDSHTLQRMLRSMDARGSAASTPAQGHGPMSIPPLASTVLGGSSSSLSSSLVDGSIDPLGGVQMVPSTGNAVHPGQTGDASDCTVQSSPGQTVRVPDQRRIMKRHPSFPLPSDPCGMWPVLMLVPVPVPVCARLCSAWPGSRSDLPPADFQSTGHDATGGVRLGYDIGLDRTWTGLDCKSVR